MEAPNAPRGTRRTLRAGRQMTGCELIGFEKWEEPRIIFKERTCQEQRCLPLLAPKDHILCPRLAPIGASRLGETVVGPSARPHRVSRSAARCNASVIADETCVASVDRDRRDASDEAARTQVESLVWERVACRDSLEPVPCVAAPAPGIRIWQLISGELLDLCFHGNDGLILQNITLL